VHGSGGVQGQGVPRPGKASPGQFRNPGGSTALEVTLNTSQPQITFLAVEVGGRINSDEFSNRSAVCR